MDGLVESYFICEPDLPKDSDLQCTMMARMLEQAHEELSERQLDMPATVRVHTDNAVAEGKNARTTRVLA